MITVGETNSVQRLDDEGALVGAARDGDTSSFETLVRRYEQRVYRLAKMISKNDGDAEEIAQEAFLKAFAHIEDFKGDSRFYTWLVRITVNEALMKLRKRRVGQISLDDPLTIEDGYVPREIEDWGPTPEAIYSRNELAEILSGVVRQLHPRLRAVFQLRDVESLSTRETACQLRISVSAVKSRLLRARLALRGKLSRFMRNNTQSSALLSTLVARDMRQVACERINPQ